MKYMIFFMSIAYNISKTIHFVPEYFMKYVVKETYKNTIYLTSDISYENIHIYVHPYKKRNSQIQCILTFRYVKYSLEQKSIKKSKFCKYPSEKTSENNIYLYNIKLCSIMLHL